MYKRKAMIGLLLVLALVAVGCAQEEAVDAPPVTEAPDVTEAPPATEAPAVTEAPPATEAPATDFDMVAAVADYTNNIPEGWSKIKGIDAFKDLVDAGVFLIDVRETGEYAEGFIAEAVNIPLRTLAQNLDMIPTDREVFVYCKSGLRAGYATASLGLLGFDNVRAFPPGMDRWTGEGEPLSMDPPATVTYTVPEIAPEMLAAVDSFLSGLPEGWSIAGDVEAVKEAMGFGAVGIDVRTPGEFAEGYIPGSVGVTLREIPDLMDTIPTDAPLIAYCTKGWRCALALPPLFVLGFEDTTVFRGSWNAWTAAGEPVTVP